MTTTAIADLTGAFERTLTGPGRAAHVDRSAVVISWPSVPVEIIRAAGLQPVVVRGAATGTPAADAHLEAGVFPNRTRQLVEAALAGRLAAVARVVVPRTSDADYKGFLYLRELVRGGAAPTLAPVLLFDLLQSRSAGVQAYDVARTRALAGELGRASGSQPADDDLRREIARANAARAAARRLVALRRGTPRISGAEALPLLGAFWQMDPDRYAALAGEAADAIARRPPLSGPRVLLAGAPVDDPALHAAIETHGAVVVAEVGPWGNGAAGDDVPADTDPMAAIADAYRTGSIGARTPADVVTRWTEHALEDIDAVVVSLPPDDTVFGWDYPVLRRQLDARRIPHACLRGDPHAPVPAADHERLGALVAAAAAHEARHG